MSIAMMFRARDGVVAVADGLEVAARPDGTYEWRNNYALKLDATGGHWPVVYSAVGLSAVGRIGAETDVLELTGQYFSAVRVGDGDVVATPVKQLLRGLGGEIDVKLAGAGVGDSPIIVHAAQWRPNSVLNDGQLTVDQIRLLPDRPGDSGPGAIPDDGAEHSAFAEGPDDALAEYGFCAVPDSSAVWRALLPHVDDWLAKIDADVTDDWALQNTYRFAEWSMEETAVEVGRLLTDLVASNREVLDSACVGGQWRFVLVPADGGPVSTFTRDIGPMGRESTIYRVD